MVIRQRLLVLEIVRSGRSIEGAIKRPSCSLCGLPTSTICLRKKKKDAKLQKPWDISADDVCLSVAPWERESIRTSWPISVGYSASSPTSHCHSS